MFAKSPKLKLAMIPFLASLLGWVLMRDSDNLPPPAELASMNRESLVSTTKQVEWPEFEVEEIALLQPFQTLKQLEALRAAEMSSGSEAVDPSDIAQAPQPEVLQVRAIFQNHTGATAILGDQVIRVGDVLPNGKRVIAIRPYGIEVAKE